MKQILFIVLVLIGSVGYCQEQIATSFLDHLKDKTDKDGKFEIPELARVDTVWAEDILCTDTLIPTIVARHYRFIAYPIFKDRKVKNPFRVELIYVIYNDQGEEVGTRKCLVTLEMVQKKFRVKKVTGLDKPWVFRQNHWQEE